MQAHILKLKPEVTEIVHGSRFSDRIFLGDAAMRKLLTLFSGDSTDLAKGLTEEQLQSLRSHVQATVSVGCLGPYLVSLFVPHARCML